MGGTGNTVTRQVDKILFLIGFVKVFDLLISGYVLYVFCQTAEDEAAAQADDGGAPPKPVGPGVKILALEDLVVEIDGVDDQSDDLEDRCRDRWTSFTKDP